VKSTQNVKAFEFAFQFINVIILAISTYSLTEVRVLTIIDFTYWNLKALGDKHVDVEDNNLLPLLHKKKLCNQYLNVF
jgi:hypothetical protein